MAFSQNGWSVQPPLDNRVVPGTNGVKLAPGVRQGDVATVLFYVAARYNLLVEQLVPGWCWGYNYRLVRGASSTSNHSSGTAGDLNSPKHPLGKTGTYTDQQRKALLGIAADCRGVIRFGEFYVGRKDGMHVEIVGSAAQTADLAKDILAGRLPGGPDGTGGAAVPADTPAHVVVPAVVKSAPAPAQPAVVEQGVPAPDFPLGGGQYFGPKEPLSNKDSVSGYFSHRDDLRAWQERMKHRGWAITPDGLYGDETDRIATAFQRDKGISADGLVGPQTWSLAWTADITR
jgi:hypothetical protein